MRPAQNTIHGSRTSPRTVLLIVNSNYLSVRPECVEGFRVPQAITYSSFSPELIEESTFFHVIQVAAIDELLGFHLLCPRIRLRHIFQDRLQAFLSN